MEGKEAEETKCEGVSNESLNSTSGDPLSDDDIQTDEVNTTLDSDSILPELEEENVANNNTETSEPPVVPTVSEEECIKDQVSLPPASPVSVSDTIVSEPQPAVRNNHHPHHAEDLPLILCSLSIDSLHCIASFLAPADWANFGQANHATNRVCNQVFRRVRMHGFRCATEVISAWKLGQHADARELSALYTKTGVPIYPYSLGHSYHTITWRMGVEAKVMQGDDEESPEGESQSHTSRSSTRRPMDRFYTERYDTRLSDGFSSPSLTYMEEKSLFWYQQENENLPASAAQAATRAAVDMSRTLIVPRPPILQAQGPPAAAVGGGIGVPVHFPDFRPIGSDQSLDSQRQTSSSSFAEMQPTHAKRPAVRVHRHLVDQHMLGRSSVDDDNGAMRTAPVSLSADFYHPFIAAKSSSSRSKVGAVGHPNLMSSVNQRGDAVSPTMAPGDRLVPPIPTPPPSNEVTPAATPRRESLSDGMDVIANNGDDIDTSDSGAARLAAIERSLDIQTLRTPTSSQLEPPIFSPPQLQVQRSHSPPGTPPRIDHPVLSSVDLEIYSSSSLPPPSPTLVPEDGIEDLRNHLRTRFASYQRRLDLLLADRDNEGFEECILDFWDEFFPTTANIHFYDRYTAVPRVSCLQKFLTRPCPKAIGVVQCEIERIKVHSKKKGVNMKGRLFPSYEYRLFIRDRRHSTGVDNVSRNPTGEPRRDTVLMVAKNRAKRHTDANDSSSSKKPNYYLFTPQQSDIDAHYNAVNEMPKNSSDRRPNGASYMKMSSVGGSRNVLLGRLQSNFIGTEFQIFSHEEHKMPPRVPRSFSIPYSDSENELDYDSGVSSDTMSTSSRSHRRKNFRRKPKRSSLRRRRTAGDSAVDQPQPIDEELPTGMPEKRRSLRRAVSLPVMPYNRSSRTSRRAIAHSIEPMEPQPVQLTTTEEEEGAITYTANLLGNRPRIMDVCVPKVSSDGVAGAEWKRYLDSCDDDNDVTGGSSNRMLNCFKQVQARSENPGQADAEEDNVVRDGDDYVPPDDFGLLALQNRPPWWNIELGAFVLNFGGRVSVASVKNFQLCDRNDQDHIMLQFGRIQGRHSFTMDFQHPLTAVQAFAVAISSLQSKISFG